MARMARTSTPPTKPPGLNVYRLRTDRGWTLDELAAAIRRATTRTYTKSALSRLEQHGQYSAQSIADVATGLGVPLFALFAEPGEVLYYDLTEEGQAKVREYIRDLAGKYRR